METLRQLEVNDQFYFPENRGTIFTVLEYIIKNGQIRRVKTLSPGKIYPVYFSPQKQVLKIGINENTETNPEAKKTATIS